jgi:hypothetical protein
MRTIRAIGLIALSTFALVTRFGAPGELPVGEATLNGIRVTVAGGLTPWIRKGRAEIHVKIEGLAEQVEVIPVFVLVPTSADSGAYWAPVNLLKGLPLEVNNTVLVSPSSAATLDVKIDPSALLWGRRTAALWPRSKFVEVVPPGRYRLHVQLDVLWPKPTGRKLLQSLTSNRLAVEVE